VVRTGFRPPPSRRLTRRYRCFAATRRAELRCRSHRPRLPATRGRAVSRICHMAHTISAGGKRCAAVQNAVKSPGHLHTRSNLAVANVDRRRSHVPTWTLSRLDTRTRPSRTRRPLRLRPAAAPMRLLRSPLWSRSNGPLRTSRHSGRPSYTGRRLWAGTVLPGRSAGGESKGPLLPPTGTAVRARDLCSCPWPEESEGPLPTPWRSRGPLLSLPDRPVWSAETAQRPQGQHRPQAPPELWQVATGTASATYRTRRGPRSGPRLVRAV